MIVKVIKQSVRFVSESMRYIFRGNISYYAWMIFLLILMLLGAVSFFLQMKNGLIVTNMRDQVSWAFYIGNFTFLVGVAAAAVMLVIPAYVYNWGPIKEIVILGELLAISAIVMCLGFVTVDIGRPDRFLHLMPPFGKLNIPQSLLAWDVIALNGYLVLNLVIVFYLLYCSYTGVKYKKFIVLPLVLSSIPAAVSIHTVTAFLYCGIAARPFWNSAILAPRFLASAFCSGPAVLLIVLQILRKTTKFKVKDEAIWKIAELMAYAMCINLFLLGAEVFKDFYSNTHHVLYMKYMFFGLGENNAIVGYMWLSVVVSFIATILFLIPKTRTNFITLNIGSLLIYAGVYIEKGMGLIIPGFTPDTLGEIYEYTPSFTEITVAAGIFSLGFFVFTLMLKVAIPIVLGDFRMKGVEGSSD